MRKIVFLFSFLLFSVCQLNAQSIQKVRVLEYRGDDARKPLANVEVIVGNAGSVVTDSKGCCQLQFRTLKAGDKVVVRRISRSGYEVLNPESLDQWYIMQDTNDEYVILMVSSKRLKAERDRYMQVAENSIRQSYVQQHDDIADKLNRSMMSKAEYDMKVRQLRQECNDKLDNIDNYIDRIVHTDLSQISEREKVILSRVKSGDIDGALAEYERINIVESYRKRVEERRKLEAASEKILSESRRNQEERYVTYQSVLRQNDIYRMSGGSDNIEAGLKLWHDFAYADTTFSLPLLEYARYCMMSYRFDEATDALAHCCHSHDTVTLIRAELLKAEILLNKGRYRQATPTLEQVYRYTDSVKTTKGDNSVFLTERAYALYQLCMSYSYLRDADKGRAVRQLAVDACREAYEWDKGNLAQKRKYVDALYAACISVIHFDYQKTLPPKQRNPEALERSPYLDQAIAMQEELYQAEPVKQCAMLAFLYCKKADVLYYIAEARDDLSNGSEIESTYLKSINLYKEAIDHNPRAYTHHLANAYSNYGLILANNMKLDDPEKIINLMKKAVEYERLVFEYSPDARRHTYALMLSNLGDIYMRFKDYDNAEKTLLDAEQELLALYGQYPKTYEHNLRNVYANLSDLYAPESMNSSEKLVAVLAKLKKFDTK